MTGVSTTLKHTNLKYDFDILLSRVTVIVVTASLTICMSLSYIF